MDHLWTFASEAETFELKDIVAALSEIQVGQHQPKLPTLPCGRKIQTLPKVLRTQAMTALTSSFGLVGLVW